MDTILLLNAPLFKGLSQDEIDSAISDSSYRIRKYKSGTLIAQTGEKVNSFMMVITGTVKGEMVDYSGRIIKIEDVLPMGTIASAFIFGSRNTYPVNVITVTDTELIVIDKTDFLRLLKSNVNILGNFLDMISNRSQFLSEKIKFLNFKTIKSKLAQYILQLYDIKKGIVRFDRTQNDMADFFGVARPSIARALSEMEADGLILANGKEITVLNEKKLKEMTND